jgi:hypothetical protein
MKKIFLVFVLLLCIGSVTAFFETPSNNIIVSNNIFNSSLNLSELYLNGSLIQDTYVPYTGATSNLNLGTYDLTALNINANNGLAVTRAGIPQIYFRNSAGSDGTGISLIGQVNKADSIDVYYPSGKIDMNRKGTWSGADSRNYNSYMTFSTLNNGNLFENMRIDGTGNIGIGTDDPQWKLDIEGQAFSTIGFKTNGWVESSNEDYTSNGWVGFGYDATTLDTATYFGMQQYGGGDNIFNLYGFDNESNYFEYSLGTDGDDGGKFKIGIGYALDGAFDRNDFVMNKTGDIYIDKSLTTKGDIKTTENNLPVKHTQYWSNEQLYNQYYYPWIGHALASGSSSQFTSTVFADHPGVNYFRSTTGNANSGYAQQTLTLGKLAGGEKTTMIFYVGANFPINTSNIRFGFMNSAVGSITITQGAYIDIIGLTGATPIAYAKTINGASSTTHATTGSIPASDWYRAEITVNNNATSINFKITDSPETTTLLDVNITTNIPTSIIYNKVTAYTSEAGTPTRDLMFLDFMDLEINRVLDR